MRFFSYILLISSVLFLGNTEGIKRDPPNVVLIFMDDMGYGDPGCYGGGPYSTPNMDKLAAQGVRFSNFYAAQAVCSASRAALLTGCYPTRIGFHGALDHNSRIALNPAEETIAELLKPAGYTSALIGKWHLGHKEPYLPLQHGFDSFFGLPYSNDMWPVYYDGTPWTDTTSYRSTYPALPLYDGNRVVKTLHTLKDQDSLTQLYTARAVQFIEANKKRPFFLYLAHSMVHVPLGVSNAFKGKSGAGLFGDVMEEVDWSVGKILQTLEKEGLSDNTIVIFTSDNGPWLTFGNHAGNTGGLREGKGSHWDGGLKVPCMVKWPKKIPPGVVSYGLASTLDILPTLVEWCGGSMPRHKIDGVSLRAVLEGTRPATPRSDFVYYYDKNNLKAIRDARWKLVFPCTAQTYAPSDALGKDGFPGKYGTAAVPMALYDLATDPGEDRDVQHLYPEVVQQLRVQADKYRYAMGDGLTGTVGTEVRPAAQITPEK